MDKKRFLTFLTNKRNSLRREVIRNNLEWKYNQGKQNLLNELRIKVQEGFFNKKTSELKATRQLKEE